MEKRRPPGRPPKSEEERLVLKAIRLSQDELAELDAYAEAEALSWSSAVRRVLRIGLDNVMKAKRQKATASRKEAK